MDSQVSRSIDPHPFDYGVSLRHLGIEGHHGSSVSVTPTRSQNQVTTILISATCGSSTSREGEISPIRSRTRCCNTKCRVLPVGVLDIPTSNRAVQINLRVSRPIE